jgi:hypothetical protein
MLIGVLWPGLSVRGRAGEAILKLAMDADALLMVTLVVELFVTVSASTAFAPATTVPKLTLALARVRFC